MSYALTQKSAPTEFQAFALTQKWRIRLAGFLKGFILSLEFRHQNLQKFAFELFILRKIRQIQILEILGIEIQGIAETVKKNPAAAAIFVSSPRPST